MRIITFTLLFSIKESQLGIEIPFKNSFRSHDLDFSFLYAKVLVQNSDRDHQNAPAGSDTLFHIIISEQTCLKTVKSQFREDPHFMFCIADH